MLSVVESKLTTDSVLPILTAELTADIVTSVDGPLSVTPLDVPDIVIVVVIPSNVTTVESSGIDRGVTMSSRDTTVSRAKMDTVVEISGRVKVVDIVGSSTEDSPPESRVISMDEVPNTELIVSDPSVVSNVADVTETVDASLSSVPSIHVLVVPEMGTSVMNPSTVEISTLSSVRVETVTLSPPTASCLAYRSW